MTNLDDMIFEDELISCIVGTLEEVVRKTKWNKCLDFGSIDGIVLNVKNHGFFQLIYQKIEIKKD